MDQLINGGNHEISPLRKQESGLAGERKDFYLGVKSIDKSCFWASFRDWETQCISPIASGGFSLCLYIEFSKTFFN